jgi:two-component system CheB/CheR fusion protein
MQQGFDEQQVDAMLVRLLRTTEEYSVVLTDTEGRIGWLNDTAARVLCLEKSAALGTMIDATFTPRDRQLGVPEQERRIATELGFAHNERWHVRSNGAMFWGSGVMTVVRDEQGRIQGHCKMFRDRTDLREQIRGLENTVREADAVQDRCLHSLGTFAHELRAPLGAMVNATAVIKSRAAADDAGTAAIQILERQLAQARKLVDDLLDVTRITTGKMQLQLVRTTVQDIIVKAAETVLPDDRARARRMRLILPSQPISVMADPARLEQVFINLLANAVKFTPPDRDIAVSLAIADQDAIVYVADSGIGIPKELLPRIFDLFTQAPSAHAADGLGIGLALVRELVNLHGGSVQVRSDGLDKGSEFTVRLPLADSHEGAPDLA